MTPEELKKENEELKLALKKREDEVDAKIAAALEEARSTGIRKIHGKVKLTLEAPDGKKSTTTYGVADGHPNIRYNDNRIVVAATLLKLANGLELDKKEIAASPALEKATKEEALGFFAAMAARQVGWLVKLSTLLLLFLFSFSTTSEAQIRDGKIYEFEIDTLTNADTLVLTFPYTMYDKNVYSYAWQIVASNISDTTSMTILTQESIFPEGDYWVNVDTATVTDTDAFFMTGTTVGHRQRLYITNANIGLTELLAIVRYWRN